MPDSAGSEAARRSRTGTLAGLATYSIWGLFPLYWRLLARVENLQVLSHRIVWALLFSFALVMASGRREELRRLLADRRRLLMVAAAGIVVTSNWGIYIWAINSGRVLESSLGYYINPILSVVLGSMLFRERVDRWTKVALLFAVAGFAGAVLLYGALPWISLAIALTFAAYGALKKRAGVTPTVALAVETLAASPFAVGFLTWRHATGAGAFGAPGPEGALHTALLVLSGVVTGVPLLFFAVAANRITLQRLGFLQYVSPSLQLLVGVAAFGERPGPALQVAFAGVLASAAIYAFTRRPIRARGGPGAAG